jgi:hypothetical protein
MERAIAGEAVGVLKSRRLEKELSTLSTLCLEAIDIRLIFVWFLLMLS